MKDKGNKWEQIVKKLKENNFTIATMESCTGGGIANEITNIPGASEVLKESLVTYSNKSKIRHGVPELLIDRFSVYSEEVAIAMAKAVKKETTSDVAIGVTGQLGSIDPNNSKNVINHVWFAIVKHNDGIISKEIVVPNKPRDKQKEFVINEIAECMLRFI